VPPPGGNGIDYARQRREEAETMALCDELERLDRERAADELEQLTWKDSFGWPIEGHESPRFVSERKAAYHDFLMSSEGRRTLENVHPKLADQLRRRERAEPSTPYLRQFGPQPTEVR